MQDEWRRLRKMGTWDDYTVMEWRDAAKLARGKGEEAQFGYLLGLCFEKGSELPAGHKDRKFKGRAVFLGDNVKDQDHHFAVFEELGSAPLTMSSARVLDAVSLFPGFVQMTSDAQSAYTQAFLKGVPAFAFLCTGTVAGRLGREA